jgi:cysteine desulfuration protein SufE
MNDLNLTILSYPAGSGTVCDKQTILQNFAEIKMWEDKYRELLKLSRNFPTIPVEFRMKEHEVSECESKVWLFMHRDNMQKYHFAIESDSRIVKALLIALLAAVNHDSANSIQSFDIVSYFRELGFDRHLTPSRSNGIYAVWKKMSDFCTCIP